MLSAPHQISSEQWYLGRLRKKSHYESLRTALAQTPYEYYFLEELSASYVPSVRSLITDTLVGQVLLRLPVDAVVDFSRAFAEWLRLERSKGGVAYTYPDGEVQNLLHLLRTLDRPVQLAPSIPADSSPAVIPAGHLQGVGGPLHPRPTS